MKILRVACIQNNAGKNTEGNLQFVRRALKEAVKRKVKLAALPEMFYWRGPSDEMDGIARKVSPSVLREMRDFARRNKISILLGSLLEPAAGKKYYNASYLISEKGTLAAHYRKIHLFDIDLKQLSLKESEKIARGNQIVSGSVWGISSGLSVCYDLRFPELYRKLSQSGAKILFVPANFTYTTGQAHWETLLRARAIENQAFVIAPGQCGTHPTTKVRSYGNSLIIDPWGKILMRGSTSRQELIVADLHLDAQEELREAFPVLKHRRLA